MSFINAGNEAVRAAYKARAAAERNKPKYERFGKQAIEDQTAQDLLSMAIRGRAQQNAIALKANETTKEINQKAEDYYNQARKRTQMAGKLAGGAAMLGSAYFMSKRKPDAPDERIAMLQGYKNENNELGRKEQEEYNQLSTKALTETVSEQDSTTDSTVASATPTTASKTSSQSILGDQTSIFSRAADITGKYESDSMGGYNAYNLGGSKGGTVAHGSGNSSDGKQFGGALTSMSIGKIKQLQSSGKLHAAGRFQFIGNSLPEAAKFAGLSDNDVFSPENQNKMFMAFGQKYGSGRWVGLDKATQEERDIVNQAFNQYQP